MPGTKRPNRKPGKKKKRVAADTAEQTEAGAPNAKGAKPEGKSFGPPKGSQSINSPAMTRGSARSR
jgi:hypothetical protein